MRKGHWLAAALMLGLVSAAAPVAAEVTAQTEAGFVIKHSGEVPAGQAEVWAALVAPAKWWSSEHTWSHDAANLYLDAQATGCFCEKLPKLAGAPAEQRMGSAEHMHVIFADPQRGVLRMAGALGPLQGEAVRGVLTITLTKTETGTRIEWEYVVGGYMRFPLAEIAPAVDQVIGEQLGRLAALLTPAPASAPTS